MNLYNKHTVVYKFLEVKCASARACSVASA